jgi:uncharacterized NAD(P)/FAD-binding protein YdhS
LSAPRIAVIGAGFSGLLTAVHLSRRLPDAELWLIEKGSRFAEGAAYSTREADHVLNVRLGNMSAFPDEPEHLSRWLATQPHWSSKGAFITRGDYGRYLRSILSDALSGARSESDSEAGSQTRSAAGSRLKLVHDEVLDLTRAGGGWQVLLGSGETLAVDVAVLALGNLEPARPSGLDEAVVAAGRYIADPWRGAANLPDDARRILLIGSSLTMVDVALSHARPGRRFFALSRRGLAPRAHKAADLALTSRPYSGSPLTVLRQARRAALTSDWRAVIDDLRRSARTLWRSWSRAQRGRFLRHLRPIWDVHRHRLAPAVASRIQSMIASGELSIEAGRIERIEPAGTKVLVTWRRRGRGRTTTRKVDVVINCTGPLADVVASQIPLVKGLVASGYGRADPDGLGLDVDEQCRVRDIDGAPQDELYAVGPMTRGAFWEVTSVPDIRIQAAEVAEVIAYSAG